MNIAVKNYIIDTNEIEAINFSEYRSHAVIEFGLKSKRFIAFNSSDECDNITKEEVVLVINRVKEILNPTNII